MNKLLTIAVIACAASAELFTANTVVSETNAAEQRSFTQSVAVNIINNSGMDLSGLIGELEIIDREPVFVHQLSLPHAIGAHSNEHVTVSLPFSYVAASNTIFRILNSEGVVVQEKHLAYRAYDLSELNTLRVTILPFVQATDGNPDNLAMYRGIEITSNLK